jgi:indolepyruvate ferredoxin oxidoreductase
LLEAEGVKRVIVTTDDVHKYRDVPVPAIATVRPRERLLESEKELAAVSGVTVLIHDQECAAEKRRLRKRGKVEDPNLQVFINERVCEGCGDCGQKSNCLSVIPIETEFGRKTAIHQSSCNKDYSCLQGDCPSFVTIKRTGPAKPKRRPMITAPAGIDLPEPVSLVPRDNFTIYMTGIGGTGVVTVDQILGTAAVIAGRSVRTLDLFGGSQKAGPVASHLRISTQPAEHAYTIPNGAADALLMFDILVGTEASHIAKADSVRTVRPERWSPTRPSTFPRCPSSCRRSRPTPEPKATSTWMPS